MEAFAERNVRGAIALVSGASKGIGANLVAELAKRGARVISLSRSLPAAPVEGVDYRICDLGNREQIAAVIKTLQEEGLAYIDLLVVNAAVMPGIFMPVAAVDDALEEECFATNLVGAHFLTKYALPLLLASPYSPGSSDGGAGPSAGTIDAPAATVAGKRYSAPAPGFTHSIERTVVYVSSSAGFLEEPEEGNGMLAYRASKAGLNGLMVALHALYVDDSETAVRTRGGPGAPKLQRVVSVHPGFVQTGLGRETAPPDAYTGDDAAYSALKAGWGAISLAEGTDTLLWSICARDGEVRSGKLYTQRKVHSF